MKSRHVSRTVWVSEDASSNMLKAAATAHPLETGGVLIGVLGRIRGRWRAWVTHAVEVRSDSGASTRYELPVGARLKCVKRARQTDARLGYLGDWHAHPADVGPSSADVLTIGRIAISGDQPQPLLFIVRRTDESYVIDARQWTGSELRRLHTSSAGPLSQPTRSRRAWLFRARRSEATDD
jgi:proteasome lid subunit RPN8/RPN11